MAVRGLGCPVRVALTAGQKGDAPRAGGLIADMGADIVIPNTPSRALKYPTAASTPRGS